VFRVSFITRSCTPPTCDFQPPYRPCRPRLCEFFFLTPPPLLPIRGLDKPGQLGFSQFPTPPLPSPSILGSVRNFRFKPPFPQSSLHQVIPTRNAAACSEHYVLATHEPLLVGRPACFLPPPPNSPLTPILCISPFFGSPTCGKKLQRFCARMGGLSVQKMSWSFQAHSTPRPKSSRSQ